MSQRSPLAAAWLLAACALSWLGCSGSNNESLDNLASGRRDASVDSATSQEPDAGADPQEDASSAPDAEQTSSTLDAGDELDAGAQIDAGADGASADAPPVDAGADAATVTGPDAGDSADGAGGDADTGADAAAPRVRLSLTRAGQPVAHAYVIYHGVEAQVVGVDSTDDAGVAQSELELTALSVVLPRQADTSTLHLFTYFGAQLGDDLKLELPSTDEIDTSYTLALTAHPDAVRYDAVGGPRGCLRGGTQADETTLTLTNPAGCLAPTGNAVLVAAFSPTSDAPLLSAYALASGLAAPAAGATLQVPVGAFQAYQDVHVVAQNLPQDVSAQVRLSALLGDQQLPLVPKGVRPELSAKTLDVEFGAPSFAFDAFLTQADYFADSTQTSLLWRSADSSTAKDLGCDFGNALPSIREFLVDMDARAAPRVYWSSDDSPARDAYLFEVRLFGREGGAPRVIWSGLAPPAARQARFPHLPEDLAAAIPMSDAYSWRIERLTQIGHSGADDYDAFRQHQLLYIRGGVHLTEPTLMRAGHAELGSYGILL